MLDSLNFGGRTTPLIRQAEGSECGLACLAMVAGHYGLNISLSDLRRRFQMSLKGATLKHLMGIAEELGFSARPLRGEVADLTQTALPAILHWNLNHFVVLTRITSGLRGRRFHINDPASGSRQYGEEEFSRHFTGVILELVKSESFRPRQIRSNLKINQLWSRMHGFWPTFRQIFLLSAVLQLVALVTPFFMQISIDTALPAQDGDLLLVLALGFGGVAIVAMLTSWVRSLVLVRLGTSLSYQVNINLFRHLLRLPLSWFERRHVGDVISRFGSTKPISDLLSQGLISTLIDGLMAILTLALMFVYSPMLSVIAITALLLVACLRLGFFSVLNQANVNMVMAMAKENSVFIESLRGISTIKAFGEEANRQRFWQQRKAEAVNAEIKSGRINAGFAASEQFVMGIERVLFVYLAIRYAMTGALSVGMIFALQSYRQQFLDAVTRLIQQAMSYRLLDMHLSRIADIALGAPESITSTPIGAPSEGVPVRITLRNVRFRYGANEPEVLKGIDLDVQPGEIIALVGASGNGKTTLIKIMMGLLSPTAGEVLIDGTPLAVYGLMRWRREIASVAQDDALFAGTLADNICMFDPEPNDAKMKAASHAASIDVEIARMPMRYHTPVGDMGSVLSGGQKQRVMLARAMYRQPTALFLDEATAHLDAESEFKVGEAVQAMPCTRVIIAHRPQTIERASKAFLVRNGVLQQIQLSRSPIAKEHQSSSTDEAQSMVHNA